MKSLLPVVALLFFFACSFTPPVPSTNAVKPKLTQGCVPVENASCATATTIDCPDLFADGCLTGASTRHECMARTGPSCLAAVKWDCPQGFVDACDVGTSTRHFCVATNGGMSCDQETAFECPAGFKNRCPETKL